MKRRAQTNEWVAGAWIVAGAAVLSGLTGCTGDDGAPGPPGSETPATPTEVKPREDSPGIELTITRVDGATGAAGTFQVGDHVTVTYTLEKRDGSTWNLAEMTRGRALLSGPTFNYNRVLPEERDVVGASRKNPDGSYSYTFPARIPATYAAPYNDTPTFGAGDGELSGQALLSGTYTVGLYFTWDYTVGQDSFRDAGNATKDFLLGGSVAIQPRAVVSNENCNRCHDSLRAHGGMRRDVTLCLLCHTKGAEDKNEPTVAGGTPDVTIDFRTMIHKIHNGAHLPSVLGVATKTDGSGERDYTATPRDYEIVGFGNSVHDYSSVEFPAWPGGLYPMPRDDGYSSLGPAEQLAEDTIRRGVTDCAVCHGDPDGVGPLSAPAQGALAYSQPSRAACGACHDDVDWDEPYAANTTSMPPQATDSQCLVCHQAAGDWLAVADAHLHPLEDPARNPGLTFDPMDLVEAGVNDNDGTIDPGEAIEITFRILDGQGALEVDASDLTSMSAVLSGPTSNYNLILNASFPTAALSGPQPYTTRVPELVQLETVGESTGVIDVFVTVRTPHWAVAGAETTVFERSATGGGSTLVASASAHQNYLDVVSALAFAPDDYVVLDDGDPEEEFLRIQFVEGNRLWFSSPFSPGYAAGTRLAHAAGATVDQVTLDEMTEGVDYSLDPVTGTITELFEHGAGGEVVVTYTSDFLMPATYPMPLNESPDLDEVWGEWRGKSLVEGTYSLGLWGFRSVDVTPILLTETTTYRGAAPGATWDFLVGSATVQQPYDLIDSAESCNECHQDLWFHGGTRRGFGACLVCHGTAGAEDRPRYIAPGAPDTTGTTINLRTMLHKIHMGAELANASSYAIVGRGPAPDNYSVQTYEEVVFPSLPGGVKNCEKCHGAGSTAWREPSDRDHPTEQGAPVRSWRAVCGACHDSDDAADHIDGQTFAGYESCGVCHGGGDELDVELVHKVRF